MKFQPSIEEHERLANGYAAMLEAVNKVLIAQKDLDMFPGSFNYKRKLHEAMRNLKKVGNNEYEFFKTIQQTLFK